MYQATYRDGTVIGNLSYEESLDIFEEAKILTTPVVLAQKTPSTNLFNYVFYRNDRRTR